MLDSGMVDVRVHGAHRPASELASGDAWDPAPRRHVESMEGRRHRVPVLGRQLLREGDGPQRRGIGSFLCVNASRRVYNSRL